jgi:transaldolase
MNPLLQLKACGQSVWLDNLSRTLLVEGGLKRLVEQDGVSGVTSNPTIFFKAISDSPHYAEERKRLLADSALTPEQRYEALAIPDIRAACDVLRPEYERTSGEDGYVSLEVSPALAHDAAATVEAASRLKSAIGRPNLLIKVPATRAGCAAIEALVAQGISVNVTLMFSLDHVRSVAGAYMGGLERWIAAGGAPLAVKSVASLFLSRVDTLVDRRLESLGSEAALALRGRTGVALAKLAYQEYKTLFRGPLFAELARRGARPQHLLWASTGTKNPAYSDVMYVEPLIGAETVNTMPDATLAAFRDHGRAAHTLENDTAQAREQFAALARLEIEMGRVGVQLQGEGLRLFEQSFADLLELVSDAG